METLLKMLWEHLEERQNRPRHLILEAFQLIREVPALRNQYNRVINNRRYPSGIYYVHPHIAQEIRKHYGLRPNGIRHKVTNELIKSYSELNR